VDFEVAISSDSSCTKLLSTMLSLICWQLTNSKMTGNFDICVFIAFLSRVGRFLLAA